MKIPIIAIIFPKSSLFKRDEGGMNLFIAKTIGLKYLKIMLNMERVKRFELSTFCMATIFLYLKPYLRYKTPPSNTSQIPKIPMRDKSGIRKLDLFISDLFSLAKPFLSSTNKKNQDLTLAVGGQRE
jgi:hypothetical protein